MGIIIGKFRRKKTTLEVLEKLEEEINEIEGFRRDAELAKRKIAGRFILVSFGVYLVVAFVICYYFLPPTTSERVKYIGPLLCVPVLLLFTRKILGWYYNRKLTKNQTKLKKLKEEKKKTLDKVMDTETYKVAKEILEKFAPEQVRKPGFGPLSGSELTPVKSLQTPVSGVRYRSTAQASQLNRTSFYGGSGAMTPGFKAPALPGFTSTLPRSTSLQSTTNSNNSNLALSTPMPLPRPILPRDRSVLDKMVEYLIGDGPSNRYALVCKNCDAHNGMALKEEFEYLSFRCCYCQTLNPARKQRPAAPKLEFDTDVGIKELRNTSDTSDSEKNSASDTEDETDDETNEAVTTLFSSKPTNNEDFPQKAKITELDDSPMEIEEDNLDIKPSTPSVSETKTTQPSDTE